jgi:hypothetical protein
MKLKTSVIDVALRNLGNAPALITRAEFKFQRVDALAPCTGAGELEYSAGYDIRVPHSLLGKGPFVKDRSMRFQVKPNTVDRVGFTVGPERFGEGAWPWIYDVEILLHQDTGQTLRVGRVLLLVPAFDQWEGIARGDWVSVDSLSTFDCVTENATLLQQAVKTNGLHAPELVGFYNELLKYSSNPYGYGSTPPRPTALQGPIPHVEARSLEGEVPAERYRYEGSYPHLSSLPNTKAQSRINDTVTAAVNRLAHDNRPSALGVSGGIARLTFDYDVTIANPRILSFVIPSEWDTEFSAHPSSGFLTMTFDLRTGSQLKLSDFFFPGSKYVYYALAHGVREDLKKRAGVTLDTTQLAPAATSFKTFTIGKNGLNFFFDGCEVAACAAGDLVATVPYSALEKLIARNGPIGWAA